MSHPWGSDAGRTIRVDALEDGRVLRIVLDAPKPNVLTMQMMDEMREALAAQRDDRRLKMVLLRGAGGTFSQGASIAEHKKDRAPAMLGAFCDLVRDVASYPVPVTALVEGRCFGGAFEVVLACHLVFATRDAVMRCPEVRLGVVPPVLAVLGHHRMGGALAERLILTGADLDAATAERAGLVAGIVPPDAEPETWVLDWYKRTFASLSAFTLREATHAARHASGMLAALDGPLEAAEARYLERLLPSHDGNEGIAAFLEKRTPVWEDA
jgi:cyclohexa-1,5-dienecarbonyl-CoA hydratase